MARSTVPAAPLAGAAARLAVAPDDALFTIEDVMEITGRGRWAISRDRIDGTGIPFVRVSPRAVRYRAADIRESIRANRFVSTRRRAGEEALQ